MTTRLPVLSAVLAPLAASPVAIAAAQSQCLQALTVTGTPDFGGLKPTRFDLKNGSSAQGGEVVVFANQARQPRYVLVTHYGETGKRVALYRLLDTQPKSFSARISNYAYLEPVDAGMPRVVSVTTTSFLVCDGVAMKGAGATALSGDMLEQSRDEIAHAIAVFSPGH